VPSNRRVLIVRSHSTNIGGVAAYLNSLLPLLSSFYPRIESLQVGSTKGSSYVHPLVDQIAFSKRTRERWDLVHLNPSLRLKSLLRDGLFLFVLRRRRSRVLVFFHGWDPHLETVISRVGSWVFTKLFGRADAFVVLSSSFRESLLGWGIQAPIHVETTAVDDMLLGGFDFPEKLRRLQGTDRINVLFLARIEKEKGVFETISAVRSLIANGHSVSLTIAGEGSALEAAEKLAIDVNFPSALIRFLGYVKGQQKADTFSDCDIYCLPTKDEGLPISVLEAMSFGLPVITRPVGGLRDVVIDGESGVLLDGTTAEHVGAAIEVLLSDRKMMLDIAKKNYKLAQQQFLASHVAERLAAIYETVASN